MSLSVQPSNQIPSMTSAIDMMFLSVSLCYCCRIVLGDVVVVLLLWWR